MKNEQQNNDSQNGKQDQSNKQNPVKNNERDKLKTNQSSSQSSGNEKSNISVGNDGKIGKPHDQWNNDNNNRNNDPQKDQQVRSDKTVTEEPEIDAPIYDPEKTEKKIPQMGKNDKK
jgi:hypothetical protein